MSKKVGFLFGAGAETSYGMPNGGKFALDIFRVNPKNSKEKFKAMKEGIDSSKFYASNWLPEDYEKKKVHVFGDKVYEVIIRDTIGNNRKLIIKKINNFDNLAKTAVNNVYNEKAFEELVEKDLKAKIRDININHQLVYSEYFKAGNKLFNNTYFAVLLKYYNTFDKFKINEKTYLGEIIKAIFQLQIGAMSEDLSRVLEDNVFSKDELELDIFDDLGGGLKVSYELAGIAGLRLLSKPKISMDDEHTILKIAYEILEIIYADVLDYKSLIDMNWHYLYSPNTEWAKFSRIVTFLYMVQEYIVSEGKKADFEKNGYYDDLKKSSLNINVVATSNYNSFIKEKLGRDVIYLNGNVNEYYDPYLNDVGDYDILNKDEKHFIVPLLFTQSGTKPMTSIKMAKRYVDYYEKLKDSDYICSIGFAFNKDDEHINGLIRDLIDKEDKKLVIISIGLKKEDYVKRLKVKNEDNIKVINVSKNNRTNNEKLWVEHLE